MEGSSVRVREPGGDVLPAQLNPLSRGLWQPRRGCGSLAGAKPPGRARRDAEAAALLTIAMRYAASCDYYQPDATPPSGSPVSPSGTV